MKCARFWGLLVSSFVAAVVFVASAWSAPCIHPVSNCTEWLTIPGHKGRVMLYRTHALDSKTDLVTHALVAIHGTSRDAYNNYLHALTGGFLGNALERTIIISPRFAAGQGRTEDGRECRDTLATDELSWVCGGKEHWKNGGAAASSTSGVTSFDVMDEIMRLLAQRDVFPNLRSVVMVGHSAGAQVAARYGMANRIHEKLPFRLSYVVANPSSHTYLDPLRPTRAAMVSRYPAFAPGYQAVPTTVSQKSFVEFSDANGCTGYNKWPYGLEERVGYTANISDADLKRQLCARPFTYLLGELDILPLYGFDTSCSAMAQGPTRLARGLAYAKHVNEVFGAHHQLVLVPACGHNARCMFSAEVSLPVLFPKD